MPQHGQVQVPVDIIVGGNILQQDIQQAAIIWPQDISQQLAILGHICGIYDSRRHICRIYHTRAYMSEHIIQQAVYICHIYIIVGGHTSAYASDTYQQATLLGHICHISQQAAILGICRINHSRCHVCRIDNSRRP